MFAKYFGPYHTLNLSQVSVSNSGPLPLLILLHTVQVCAVGWEPNPVHTPALRALEQSYNQCGYRTIIHTETGVGVRNSRNKVRNNQEIL